MKGRTLIFILCMAVFLISCSGKKQVTATEETGQVTKNEVLDTIEPEEDSEDPGDLDAADQLPERAVSTEVSGNDTAVYIGADSVTEVKMGACIEGSQTPLCSIKMPTNYFAASAYMDESGQNNTMLGTDGKLLSEIIEDGSFENSDEIPAMVTLTAQGSDNNSYAFVIVSSNIASVDSEKEYVPGGMDLNLDGKHMAYVYGTSGQYDVVLVYEINDRWTLMIENGGQLKDQMSLDKLGEEFYRLVTPIE